MDGFINLLKPPGMTSSDAVVFARRLLPKKTPVGHGGTLDPDAAGVLPICVGRATRLFDYIIDKQKVYIGELRLGCETDTCDASGRVVCDGPVIADAARVKAALGAFVGHIMQTPPVYSALKRGGTPLYTLARRGESVDVEAREVLIDSINYIEQTAPDRHLLEIRCHKGVYIRSLMRDIARAVNCCGHMSFLLRSRAGAFDVNGALTPDELAQPGALERALINMDMPLDAYARADVCPQYRARALCGMPIRPEWLASPVEITNTPYKIYVGGEFAGMGEMRPGGLIAFRAMLLKND